jgi:predicted  nucleic acid-binding Zn ribbon protein
MSVDYKMPFQDILTDTTLSSELALYGDLWMAYAIERAIKVTVFYYATKVSGHNIPLNTWESICELYFTDNKFMSNYDIARMKRFYSRLISTFATRLP